MIRLFRKIRNRLLAENNYSLYLLYASGEIVLVMIGILLALQIDNWNDTRKQRSVTHEYLLNIREDLVADSVSLGNIYDFGTHWEERFNAYYNYYYSNQWTQQELVDSCMKTGFRFITYIPINNTFLDMLSSGKSSLLPEEIKFKLTHLKKNQDLLVIISEHVTQDIKINVHELEKYWNLEGSDYFKGPISRSREVLPEKDHLYRNMGDERLMRGLVFHHNIFNWSYKYFDLLRINGQNITHLSTEIIDLINKELENK